MKEVPLQMELDRSLRLRMLVVNSGIAGQAGTNPLCLHA